MDQFPVDVFQAGAGTSFNMNVNEVVCNLALEMTGSPKAIIGSISPNDHVNMSQSTNDTYPTASHIAILGKADELLGELDALASSFWKKGKDFMEVTKSGRTHLMDALPAPVGGRVPGLRFGGPPGEGNGSSSARMTWLELAIGGSAVGHRREHRERATATW